MKTAAAAAAVSLLCACGGGGGGGGIKEVPFTSFPVTNQRVVMTGTSESISGTNSGGGTVVNTIGDSALDETRSTLKLTYGGSPTNPTAMSTSTPASNVSFGSGVDCSLLPTCAATNANSLLVVVNPAFGPPFGSWNYQTYGVWLQQTGQTTFTAGAISAGAATPGNAVPLSGTGNFSGIATGFYINPGGTAFATAATMTADVDFFGRTVDFRTVSTMTNPLDGSPGGLNPNLDINMSNVNYASGSSQFGGTVQSAGGMTGRVNGRFFGPAAQEIGGVYSLTGGALSLERMMGAFGGRRP
jgi:hypothetical protein